MFSNKAKNTLKTLLTNGSAIATLTIIALPAFAQVEQATGIADPARIGEDLLDVDTLPELLEKVEVQETQLLGAPEGAENIKFLLETLQIDGVSAYDEQDINSLYSDKLGTTISLSDIYTVANSLTNKYRNEGFILTQVIVPPQTIENGLVKLRVVEGFVDKIIIDGEPVESAQLKIKQYAQNLRKNNILNAAQLERYLLLINDLPGITARSILSPSKTTVGASDLTIIIERDKYEAEIALDNHGSRYLGPYQVSFSGASNSLLGYNERIAGQLVVSGDKDRKDELVFGSVVYEQPIFNLGTKLRFIGGITSTEPGDDLDEFDVNGISRFFSASVSHPYIRSRTTNLSVRATFDIRNVDSRNDLEPSRQDRIRSLRLGTTYQFMDSLFGVGVNAIDIELSKGVDVLGSSDKGDANLTRSSGDPRYTKLEFEAQRLQRLTPDLNLLVAAQGQWSSAPLLSSEEFGVGGLNIGRGYDSSEIVGDEGISGKVELQWNEPYKVKYMNDYQLFTYFDAGRIWDRDSTTSTGKRESLASTGLGVRADITATTKAGLAVAFPLTHRVDTTNDRDPRFYFNVSHKF